MRRRAPVPTLWQVLADLQTNSITLREAYRLTRAYIRAARRQRLTRHSKGFKP